MPFADRLPLQAVVATSLYGQRPQLLADAPAPVRTLVESCWLAVPTDRPSFDQARRAPRRPHRHVA